MNKSWKLFYENLYINSIDRKTKRQKDKRIEGQKDKIRNKIITDREMEGMT